MHLPRDQIDFLCILNIKFDNTLSLFRNFHERGACGKELEAVYADIIRINSKLNTILKHYQNTLPLNATNPITKNIINHIVK